MSALTLVIFSCTSVLNTPVSVLIDRLFLINWYAAPPPPVPPHPNNADLTTNALFCIYGYGRVMRRSGGWSLGWMSACVTGRLGGRRAGRLPARHPAGLLPLRRSERLNSLATQRVLCNMVRSAGGEGRELLIPKKGSFGCLLPATCYPKPTA